MIEAVIFDFGGVLVRTSSWEARHRWDDRLGLDRGTVEHLVFNSDHGQDTQKGVYTEEAHWAWVGEQLRLSADDLSQLRTDFWSADVVQTKLVEFTRSLRPQIKIGLISNAMDGLREALTAYSLIELFDHLVISAEWGTMKPDPSIYHHSAEQLGVAPQAAVFIDDFAHNIVGAQAIGMNTIHHPPTQTNEELIDAINALLASTINESSN